MNLVWYEGDVIMYHKTIIYGLLLKFKQMEHKNMELKTEKATGLKIEIEATTEPQEKKTTATVNVSINGESILDVNENQDAATHSKREWTPVSEQLPDDDAIVLLTCEYRKGFRYLDIDKYNNGWTRHGDDEVIAWMPAPEPYREDEENDYNEKEL